MKNKIFISLVFIFIPFISYSQVTIGSGNPPESYSILQLDSNKGGLRLNQLNTVEQNALNDVITLSSNKAGADGLVIYETQDKTIQYWNVDKWIELLNVAGTPTDGQVLKYNSISGNIEWATLKIPSVKKGDYYLSSSTVMSDSQGLVYDYNTDNVDDERIYNYNETLVSSWKLIQGLSTQIRIPEVKNAPPGIAKVRVSVQYQTVGQIGAGVVNSYVYPIVDQQGNTKAINTPIIPAASFGIGVFVGNSPTDAKLKIVRIDRLPADGGGPASKVYNMMGTIEDLDPGTYELKVGVHKRTFENMNRVNNANDRKFSIGTSLPGVANLNPFMAQSYLKVDVYVLDTEE